MADQNYNVNYTIDVQTKGVESLKKLGELTESISKAVGQNFGQAPAKIKEFIDQINNLFYDPIKKNKDLGIKFDIDTSLAEGKLNAIKSALEEIKTKAAEIKVKVNTGNDLSPQKVKSSVDKLNAQGKALDESLVGKVRAYQSQLTKSVGKINSALNHLERSRELNIKTEVAEERLNKVLVLIRQIRSETKSGATLNITTALPRAPFNPVPVTPYILPEKVQSKLMERLAVNQALHQQRLAQGQQNATEKLRFQQELYDSRAAQRESDRAAREQERREQRHRTETEKARKESQRLLLQQNRQIVREASFSETDYANKRKAAVNRMQYSRPPSLRRMLPFAYMLNGYMLFSLVKQEVTKATEYGNLMTTARSILKVADSDLSTFESRFMSLAQNVRDVGLATKFTAVEVAGAVKYLAMAGQNIDTINQSIRPIANLALIGDNDISQVADLTTNIMAGYGIAAVSMPAVADIIASTVSRSNVNIIESAEAFKMAGGFLRAAGIDFTEAAAAVGLLGNMGVKGTMAGTSLRALSMRLAAQPKGARELLDRLGVKFTHTVEVMGKQVEKIRPLADIFEELNKKGATLGDMQKIFGLRGGNAALMLLENYEQLRTLSASNRTSFNVSESLAKVKQETTKGLWHKMTSMFSESFLHSFETLEPQIRKILRKFTENFKPEEFARGLTALASALMDIFKLLGDIASWVTRNFHWVGPVLLSTSVTVRLFKFAGAVTNLGVALGFLGKQSVAVSASRLIPLLVGLKGLTGKASFAAKRKIVTALRDAGVQGGAGSLTGALSGATAVRGLRYVIARAGTSGLFSTQVAVGGGVLGATSSLASLGAGAVVATGALSALAGILGIVAYRTWKIKEAKEAVLDELENSEVKSYPSLDALNASLRESFNNAVALKDKLKDIQNEQPLKDITGQGPQWFTENWWKATTHLLLWSFLPQQNKTEPADFISYQDAYQQDLKKSLETLAKQDSNKKIFSAFAELGKLKTVPEVEAFIQSLPEVVGMDLSKVDPKLYSKYTGDKNNVLKRGLGNMTVAKAINTYEYMSAYNTEAIGEITKWASWYKKIISSPESAIAAIKDAGLSMKKLEELGLKRDTNGIWQWAEVPKNATDNQRVEILKNRRIGHSLLKMAVANLLKEWHSPELVETIMNIAGLLPEMYSNEPNGTDLSPFNAPGISVSGLDDNGAGGNYSGTGKLHSAAPKQVIVQITNLLKHRDRSTA